MSKEGGTLECFAAGTMEWRFEVGVAVRDGILASLLAKNGATAAPTAFEGKAGFLNAFADKKGLAKQIIRNLETNWEIMDAGFKSYPVCALNQTPVLTMLDLVKENKIDSDEIKRIRIRMNPQDFSYPGINYRGPFNTVGATLMSTPFCLAVACMRRAVTLEGIHRFKSRRILSLVDRIEQIPDAKVPVSPAISMWR